MSRKERFEEMLSRMNQDLNLSEDQSSQIRGFVEGHLARRREIRQQYADNKEARKAAIRPLNKELRREIASSLKPEQKSIFRTNKEVYKGILRK